MRLYKSLAVGLLSHIPGAWERLSGRLTPPTASQCYGFALKHLTMMQKVKPGVPASLLELGPGGSLGVGIVTMLLGTSRYAGLDVVRYADAENQGVLLVKQLAEMLQTRQPLPNADGFPSLRAYADRSIFPHWLAQWLDQHPIEPARVAAVLDCVHQLATSDMAISQGLELRYVVPWASTTHTAIGRYEALMSHVALQHVDDPVRVQLLLADLLNPGAAATHQIGYDSHGLTRQWNGHWAIGDGLWRLLMGKRPFLLNRLSHSQQTAAAQAAGFEVVEDLRLSQTSRLTRAQLAPRFQGLSELDLQSSSGFLVLRRHG